MSLPKPPIFISAYEKCGGIVWFPRMLQKMRLYANGGLPKDYHAYMGQGFDLRCVQFLGIDAHWKKWTRDSPNRRIET